MIRDREEATHERYSRKRRLSTIGDGSLSSSASPSRDKDTAAFLRPQTLRRRRTRRLLVSPNRGVLRPSHQQVDALRADGQASGRRGRGRRERLLVRRGRLRRARFVQPVGAAVRLRREVSVFCVSGDVGRTRGGQRGFARARPGGQRVTDAGILLRLAGADGREGVLRVGSPRVRRVFLPSDLPGVPPRTGGNI